MNKRHILVTGANGFIGKALCAALPKVGHFFIPIVRNVAPNTDMSSSKAVIKQINTSTEWQETLSGVDTVIHLAARVHMVNDNAVNPLQDYREANVEATLNLARQCVTTGVKRFIYLSSIKVNGEATLLKPFRDADMPAPLDPYGISKLEAEEGLKRLAVETGLEVVIIRPPLVYGPGVKANFLQLMRLVKRGIPMPLASVQNRRSIIFVDNLVDVILRCVEHEDAPGHTFLVSDDYDVSIAELINSLASTMGKRSMLFPIPPQILMFAAKLIGKTPVAERLLNSLQVDIASTKRILNWTPPFSFDIGIEKTVQDFMKNNNGLA
jgi:nucleoside-diphosphate-sugar epimerase